MTSYPTVLLKNGVMRTAKNKSTLKKICLKRENLLKIERAKLLQMEVHYCSCVTGEKEKSSAKYLIKYKIYAKYR